MWAVEWLDDCDQEFVATVEKMEERGMKVDSNIIGYCRSMQTKEKRLELMRYMQANVTAPAIGGKAAELQHATPLSGTRRSRRVPLSHAGTPHGVRLGKRNIPLSFVCANEFCPRT